MKHLRNFKVFLAFMAMSIFVACDKDNDDPMLTVATQCNYKLTVSVADGAEDQKQVLSTIVTFPDHNGEMQTKNISYSNSWSATPAVPIASLPAEGVITITQNLKENVDWEQKEEYNVGISFKLTAYSMNSEEEVMDTKDLEESMLFTIPSENMAILYPETITLRFSVDANGNVSVSKETLNIELIGGCWICAYDGYSEMLTFAENGVVTSNGVKGNDTWEKQGSYLLENDILTLNFEGEKREGVFYGKNEDLFAFVEEDGVKSFNRRYPPEFKDIYGWNWDFLNAMVIHQENKDVYTSPEYVLNGQTVTNECSVTELLEKIQKDFWESTFANAQFTEDHLILFEDGDELDSYPYIHQENDVVIINFGTTEKPCNIAAQVKLFATGRMALYFVDAQSHLLLALNDLKTLGLEITEDNLASWSKSYADTFSQLVLVISYDQVVGEN